MEKSTKEERKMHMFEVSTKGRYSLQAMVYIADCTRVQERLSAREIAERCAVGQKYIEMLLVRLKKAGLLEVARGPAGGYSLAKLPQEYSVEEILVAVEGPVVVCPKAELDKVGALPEFWNAIQWQVCRCLREVNLESLTELF